MTRLRLAEWESKAALRARLDVLGDRAIVVGEAAESPQRVYSCEVESSVGTIEVGVFSSDLGSTPAAVVLDGGRVVIVGHDAWLTWVNVDQHKLTAERRLGGVFFEFVPVDDEEVVILHELGTLRVDARGGEKWCVDTDVVEDYRLNKAGDLVLRVMDEITPVVVPIHAGKARR